MMLIQILGHVGADPETRVSPAGQKIVSFRMAINSKRKGKETTVWWRVTIFGDRFDRLLPYIKKGSALIVSGMMNPLELYQDKEGATQISYEIIADSINFSPFGGKSDKTQEGQTSQYGSDTQAATVGAAPSFKPQAAQFQPASFQPRTPFGGSASGSASQQEFADDEIPF
ncbi:MAG: Single-stranded DNA-binding protein [Chlamydiia bacterium]|nr:Single-stranded DNA-binding protein [Chlamydiia bacterium]